MILSHHDILYCLPSTTYHLSLSQKISFEILQSHRTIEKKRFFPKSSLISFHFSVSLWQSFICFLIFCRYIIVFTWDSFIPKHCHYINSHSDLGRTFQICSPYISPLQRHPHADISLPPYLLRGPGGRGVRGQKYRKQKKKKKKEFRAIMKQGFGSR